MNLFVYLLCITVSGNSDSQIVIPRIERAPTLSEFSGMTCPQEWTEKLAVVEGFTQREPRDGAPSSQKTIVYLGYDASQLYVIFQAFDAEPQKVRATLTAREKIEGDDTVNIQLDTFSDQRRGYTFICNPLGVQADALWTEGDGFDFSFNALWHSEGKRTPEGFVVFMAIPFKSLRFPEKNEQQWGILLNRDIPRLNEDTFWPSYSMKTQGRLNQAGVLSGINDVSQGRNYHLIPFGFTRSYNALEEGDPPGFVSEDFDSNFGIDAKMVIKDQFVVDLTVNPDFSQVESDQPQITVNNRFEVFFPEKRPFFLENADIFKTPTQLVFTRRIEDPDWGIRLTGKTGPYAIGVMALNDAAAGKTENRDSSLYSEKATIGILRVNRDIYNQSSIGILMTNRDFGDRNNRIFALDTRILLSEHWAATMQAGISKTAEQDGEETDSSFTNTMFNRNGKSFSAHIHFLTTGDAFQSDLGFLGELQRRGTDNLHAFFSYTFWKNKGPWISWQPSVFASYVTGDEDQIIERSFGPSVKWNFIGKSSLHLKFNGKEELLTPDEFNGLNVSKMFDSELYEVSIENHLLDWLGVEVEVEWGDSVNYAPQEGAAPSPAQVLRGSLELSFKPLQQLLFDFNYLFVNLEENHSGAEIFTNDIFRSRVNWQLSRRMSARAIVTLSKLQSDLTKTFLQERNNLNSDLLLTYLINPWTAIYVGYNTNERNRQLISMDDQPSYILDPSQTRHHDGRQIFLKCSYLIQ